MTASVADRPVDLRRDPLGVVRAIDFRNPARDYWADIPAEGINAFNARLRVATAAMSDAEWLDPDGFSWAYEDLHGHVRAHHAMVGS